MGILSDYFVATEKEIHTVTPGGVPAKLPRAEAKGFGLVPLNALAASLGAGDEGVEDGDPVHSGDDYAWFVLKVTAATVDALAALKGAALPKTAKAMAATAEVDWTPKQVEGLLKKLRTLARQAKDGKKSLYLWTST